MMQLPLRADAVISECGRYRYLLTRDWSMASLTPRRCLWIMLNPSTADAKEDDATIRNICQRTFDWSLPWLSRSYAQKSEPAYVDCFHRSFTGLAVVNLYAWRETDPYRMADAMYAGQDVIGGENDGYVRQQLMQCDSVVCAWGNGPFGKRMTLLHTERVRRVLALIAEERRRPLMLDLCKSGHPRHPLYFPADAQPLPYGVLWLA